MMFTNNEDFSPRGHSSWVTKANFRQLAIINISVISSRTENKAPLVISLDPNRGFSNRLLCDRVWGLKPAVSWVTAVVKVGTWACVCVCVAEGLKAAGQSERDRVNCNLSHDKELFIRGLNWLEGQEDWREKFGGVGGVSCQRQGACPRLMIVFKSKHIPQCTSARLSYAHTDGQRKAALMLLQTE